MKKMSGLNYFKSSLLICLISFSAIFAKSPCNRTGKLGKVKGQMPHSDHHQHSTLMATIAFGPGKNDSGPIYLRTIINDLLNPKQSQLNQNGQQQVPMDEDAEGLDEIALLQVDSPEDNSGNDEEGTDGEYADNTDGTEESDVLKNARMDELISDANAMLIGRLCMPLEPLRSAFSEVNENGKIAGNNNSTKMAKLLLIEPKAYLECIAFSAEEAKAFGIDGGQQIGTWDLRICQNGLNFDALQQKCIQDNIGVNEANCLGENDGTLIKPPMLRIKGKTNNGSSSHHQIGCYSRCKGQNVGHFDLYSDANNDIAEGDICEWLGATLQFHSSNPYYFLQCQQRKFGDPCGKWVKKECQNGVSSSKAKGTMLLFNSALQLCVMANEEMEEKCPENSVPISANCSEGLICPGRDAFCSNEAQICCLPLVDHHDPLTENAKLPFVPPQQNWDNHLESDSFETGDEYEQVGGLVCPGTENVMPEGECGQCPMNRYCVPRLHGCCPHSVVLHGGQSSSAESVERIRPPPILFRCPGGNRLGHKCSGYGSLVDGCPSGYGCYRGFCCPMECPPDLAPIAFCPASTPPPSQMVLPILVPMPVPVPVSPCAALGANCFQGICCQLPMAPPPAPPLARLPICPNGQAARIACFAVSQCPNGFECSTGGGCCPIPYCPTGVQAVGRCYGRMACPVGSICSDGLCCPLPICESGKIAAQFCGIGPNSLGCGPGFECWNGGCCPLPPAACPFGVIPLGRCGAASCSAGSVCMNGFCCPLPTCVAGPQPVLATSFCNAPSSSLMNAIGLPLMPMAGGCPFGYECMSRGGGCCPLPFCSGALAGIRAYTRCSSPTTFCPSPGYSCQNGLCCPSISAPAIVPIPVPVPVPVPSPAIASICPLSASMPMSLCGASNACPIGYFCEGGGCCPQPLPLCPFGGRALRACLRGTDCPQGYGCIPLGGCCQFGQSHQHQYQLPICPYNQYPVCQCSAGMCPTGAACNAGICCAPNVAVSFYQPGMRCRRSTDCQGAASGHAICLRNICICSNGAYSNGAICIRPNAQLVRKARQGCDEFGTTCRMHLIGPKRMPMFAPAGIGLTGKSLAFVNGSAQQQEEEFLEAPIWFHPLRIFSSISSTSGTSDQRRHCLNRELLREEELLELGNFGKSEYDADSTCLPNEQCLQGKCKLRLWPGNVGCDSDAECQSRCPKTFCAIQKTTNKTENINTGRCMCRNGFLLFGRCFPKCPSDFKSIDGECKPMDEEKFWTNSTAVGIIQKDLDNSRKNC